jgi:hypothetical protein
MHALLAAWPVAVIRMLLVRDQPMSRRPASVLRCIVQARPQYRIFTYADVEALPQRVPQI